MNANEARKLTFDAAESIISDLIYSLMEKVKSNAQKGLFQADIDIYNKIPFVTSIANGIVQHFENLGYAVTVSEIDNSVKITVSWWEE